MEKTYNCDKYYTNIVRTSKYSALNFLPKSLFEQFRRVANFYFLIISLLQLTTTLSPTNEYSTIGPLTIVLVATMIKEGMEDRLRHQQDHVINHQTVEVLGASPEAFQPIYWKNLRVGHIVKLSDTDQVPADMVLLFSSHDEGEAMVETASLDGESNLKVRQCVKWNQIHPTSVQDFGSIVSGEVRCELPNKRLYSFDGVLRLSFASEHVEEIPITIENVMLRGMKMCNTKWAIGVVVGAGNDSKLIQNMKAIPSKFSRLDRTANKCIFLIFSVLFVVCCVSSIQSSLFSRRVYEHKEYAARMPFIKEFTASYFFEAWITYLILYNNMVPISLYISLEIVKWYQAKRIESDPSLRDDAHTVSARTSNVNEDLGQIKYIFSDKTGTLTKNQMLFKVCSIGGIIFDGSTMNLRRLANANGGPIGENSFPAFPQNVGGSLASGSVAGNTEAGSNGRRMTKQQPGGFADKDIRPFHHLLKMIENPSKYTGKEHHATTIARSFFRCLLLCHSAAVSMDESSPTPRRTNSQASTSCDSPTNCSAVGSRLGEELLPDPEPDRKYYGSSPDEVALLNAAKEFKCVFEDREGDLLHIRLFGKRETYRILALNEFDSTRKCMSVIVQRVFERVDDGQELVSKEKDEVASSDRTRETRTEPNDLSDLESTSPKSQGNDGEVGELEEEDDQVLVFCKGADTVMFANAVNTQDISKLGLHVHYFAAMALRTLLFGCKRLTMKEYLMWKLEYDLAKKSLSDREHLCLEAAKKIETSMTLLGATGVEDLLQDGVKDCIEQLCQAGINVWMLTGDKDETAISVAHLCGLISEKSKIVIIKGKTKQDCLDEIANARRKLKREGLWVPGVASRNTSLVINGEALELLLVDAPAQSKSSPLGTSTVHVVPTDAIRLAQLDAFAEDKPLVTDANSASGAAAAMGTDSSSLKSGSSLPVQNPSHYQSGTKGQRVGSRHTSTRPSIANSPSALPSSHETFMELATQCSSVVACRLSPMQKAQVVALMKSAPGAPLTLAVGDGGNDVSMIQEAHVGIGIYGHEGMQAVRAADFAIATFRHLSRLLLVHGRWNHRRVAKVILFSFYKNMALIMTLFLFSLSNGFSGQTLYESYLMVGWNVLYTVLPILVLGIADEDIRDFAVLKYPFVYRSSLKKSELSIQKLSVWVLTAVMHSMIVFYFAKATLSAVISEDGLSNGLFTDGTAVYGALVVTVTLKASLTMQRLHRWTRMHYVSLFGGFISFLLFVVSYSRAYDVFTTFDVFRDFYGIAQVLFAEQTYWAMMLFTAITGVIPDFALTYMKHMYLPSSDDIIQEIDSGLGLVEDEAPPGLATNRTSRIIDQSGSREDLAALGGRSDLTSSLLDGEWSQKFRDFDRPTEHDELSKQLMMLQRELAQDIGLPDPMSREDDAHTSKAIAIQPNVHPLTLEFMGEEHQQLEDEFEFTLAFRERKRVFLYLQIMVVAIPIYAINEVYVENLVNYVPIRIGMLICVLLLMRFVRTKTFLDHYQSGLLLTMLASGVTLTLTISDNGKFAATLFPIVIFVVIRVKFLYACSVVLFNFGFYELGYRIKPWLGLNPPSTVLPIADQSMFALYVVFVMVFGAYSCYSLQVMMRRDFLQSCSLLIEQKRSTQILRNMLPEHIVQRMQRGDTLISEDEKDVTILFCDIADFSSFVKRFSPTEVVSLLDRVYSLFDQICQKHGARKMETVGKTYMACAGLQGKDRGKEAALRAVSMAIDMLAILEKCRATNGNGIKLRIGIHSGRVISGLVGMKKQQFSLFGDTVNTASRMQSTGITGRCQVSQGTYKKLVGHFAFEERQIEVKGKGTMTTYILGEPISEIAHMAVLGQLEHIMKRESLIISDQSNKKTFDPDFLSATKNKIVQRAKLGMSRYDPIRILLGAPLNQLQDLHPNSNVAATANVEDDMLTEIQFATQRFKEIEMEHKYLESTIEDRVKGARTTLLTLACYALFASLRDVVVDETGTRQRAYAVFLIMPTLYSMLCAYFARQARSVFPDYTEEKLRNTLLAIYTIGLLCFSSVQTYLWRLDTSKQVFYQTRYTNLSLDAVLLMFVVSNGGSVLHRHAALFNFLAMAVIGLVILVMLLTTDTEKSHIKKYANYNENFQKSYPAVLTLIAVVTNFMASLNVEFFTRRQIWLKTRTQLETMNADRLLYQMLPAAVVMRLKEGETVCDQHQQVGILFSDIKGFTSIASQANPAQVVNILASLFCAFDKLTEKHGVFKMQTIGDAYVIVSGLPYVDMSLGPVMGAGGSVTSPSRGASTRVLPLSTGELGTTSSGSSQISRRSTLKQKSQMHIRSHIRDLLAMARDMHKEVRKVKDPNTGERLQMRIGIHIGNIIGGVIGTSTLRYDMWGPDALTANELESNGVPEKVLVSPVVMEVVKGMPDIQCTFHKKINFTNVNMMDTYLVEFIEPPEPETPRPDANVLTLGSVNSDSNEQDSSSAAGGDSTLKGIGGSIVAQLARAQSIRGGASLISQVSSRAVSLARKPSLGRKSFLSAHNATAEEQVAMPPVPGTADSTSSTPRDDPRSSATAINVDVGLAPHASADTSDRKTETAANGAASHSTPQEATASGAGREEAAATTTPPTLPPVAT
ncbi:TPA: hypothetical protein N0F65_008815 [Lagenidium giganteum]|uniref:Guanylate cyclase domain-containing protein n=1 Tax=Lagenidium giganteum TaxID=4803 RepID=A0AAV2YZG2_9STRA|nr:TPA: hypothetical protein N0F65_008815 [Lagenidium giganteum]